MNNLKMLENRGGLALTLAAALLFAGSSVVCAQSSLESGKSRFVPASEEVKIGAEKKNVENSYNEEKVNETLRSFFAKLFEKDYEGAAALMENRQKFEKTVSAMEKWRDRFMAPADLKMLNKKKNSDGTVTAVVTFQYRNANGVSDIMREKITLSNLDAGLRIRNFDSLNSIMMPAPKSAPSTGVVVPVTMPENNSPASSGDASNLINSLLSGSGQSGGAPNITSLISAIGSNNSAASIDPGELLGLMTDMVNDPDVLALATNPKIMAIAKDPSIMNTLMSGNTAAIEADPRIKELLSDPGVQKIIEKMKNKRSGGSSGSSLPSSPSSVSESQMDKIFE